LVEGDRAAQEPISALVAAKEVVLFQLLAPLKAGLHSREQQRVQLQNSILIREGLCCALLKGPFSGFFEGAKDLQDLQAPIVRI